MNNVIIIIVSVFIIVCREDWDLKSTYNYNNIYI